MPKKPHIRIIGFYCVLIAFLFLSFLPARISGQSTRIAPAPAFSDDWKIVPSAFKGDDFDVIYNILLRAKPLDEKDEFETTDQFNSRINNRSAIKLGGNRTASDNLVFVYRPTDEFSLSGLSSKYDADNQVLTITISTTTHETYKYKTISLENPQITLFGTEVKSHKFEQGRKYVATNAFGTKAIVTEYFYSNFYLAVSNIQEFPGYEKAFMSPEININLPMSVGRAKGLKSNLAAIYVADLIHPYFAIGGKDLHTPTAADPTETHVLDHYLIAHTSAIWVFDKTTGEVLVKLRAKK